MTKLGACFWAIFLVCACESRDEAGGSARSDAGDGPADDAGDAAAATVEEAYLIGTRVWDDATTTSYFQVVRSLDQATEVDLDRAIEVSGAAKLYAVEGIGWFAIGSADDPTITRYTLGDDDQLVEDERISLADYGVSGLWDTLYTISPTKMYYPDRDGLQIIIINPKDMTIEGSIDLSMTAREGFLANYAYTAVERDGKLLISVGYFDWNENDAVLGETGLLVIDTETDSVERFDSDERCGGIVQPIVTESGDAYFVSGALAAAAHELGRLDTPPCALRILDGEERFDPDYALELSDVAGTALVGEPVPGGGDHIYVRVMDEELATIEEGAATWEVTGQLAWSWARWNVETDAFVVLDALEPATADVMWFQIDGRVYGTATDAEYTETTLIELSDEGEATERLTAPGFMHGIAKIR